MAKVRQFEIKLYPAGLSGSGHPVTIFSLTGGPPPRKIITAISADDAVRQAAIFAAEHGEPCHIFVDCLTKPKPPGFDKATRELRYANMEKATATI